MRGTILTRLVAGAVLALAAGLVAPAPAQAAACPAGQGVTVVVDRGQLGGGTSTVCESDGGGDYASTIFTDAGFALTYVQRTPGFVCRVDGQPTAEQDDCVNTPPANAYGGLFWSNGTSGDWAYSNAGVGSLKVPEGGSVALVWQSSDQRRQPSVPPPAQAASSPSSSPSQTASQSPTANPSQDPSSQATSSQATSQAPSATSAPSQQQASSPSGSATATPTAGATRSDSAAPSEKPPASPTETASPTASAATSPVTTDPMPPNEGGGLPTWIVVLVLGALGAGVTFLTVSRRIS